jgi:hypothetical protein
MSVRKRSRTKRVKAKRGPWTNPKVEIAFRDINDRRKLFSVRTCHLECCVIA